MLKLQEPVLSVSGLSVEFRTGNTTTVAVDGVDFDLYARETLGIVGESGSGKSVTVLAALGLLPDSAVVTGGSATFRGENLLTMPQDRLARLRGQAISMVFQDPMTSLNPVHQVGSQVRESITVHNNVSRRVARSRAVSLMEEVGIPEAANRYAEYPHAYSGGMRQRVMIAMALANSPQIMIADEPTTALDVTIQAQVLDLLREAKRSSGSSQILITHDLGVIAEMAQRVVVMYAGQVVESGLVADVFSRPLHPYTRGLLQSLPPVDATVRRLTPIEGQPRTNADSQGGCPFVERCPVSRGRDLCRTDRPHLAPVAAEGSQSSACHFATELLEDHHPLSTSRSGEADAQGAEADGPEERREVLRVEDLVKSFRAGPKWSFKASSTVRVVNDVSFSLHEGETLGLVGESGCGKTTTAKTVLRLIEASHGSIVVNGTDVLQTGGRRLRALRRQMQIVLQDPYSSLEPRMTVHEIVAEPLRVHRIYKEDGGRSRIVELLGLVGLGAEALDRFPHQFSGGQRQRISIARALALRPKLLVLDEPVSALDVSIRAQIVNLLMDLQRELALAMLFISHDLSVVKYACDRVAVMYLGRIVEVGTRDEIFGNPRHPYTRALLSAVPSHDPVTASARTRIVLHGDIPSIANPPSGCGFRTRCWMARERCSREAPELTRSEGTHLDACHYS